MMKSQTRAKEKPTQTANTKTSTVKIGVIGLGYVGLPLARLLATRHPVVGFDVNRNRVEALQNGVDATLEVEESLLKKTILSYNPLVPCKANQEDCVSENGGPSLKNGLFCSPDVMDIQECNYYIITVPTPIDKNKRPDLGPLYSASETVGRVLKKGDIVIYESTVYPGATEEECVPVLERTSGLKFNEDFFVGYSPERINPGDKKHTVDKILKITSGSTPEAAQKVNQLYADVITAGTYLAPSIKVAEAAKVIENSQRDINIAFVNELAKIFNILEIDTQEVLKAAGTKWNFLPFTPGLVGGHCIGVDPYYLAQKAQQHGYHPEIILAGRRMNDSMGEYVASQVVKCMIKKEIAIGSAKVLMLGVTFKENCPDVRNTKIVDVIKSLEDYGIQVTTFDPWATPAEVLHEYNVSCTDKLPNEKYDAIILGVAHNEFLDLDLNPLKKENAIVYDVKGVLENTTGKL